MIVLSDGSANEPGKATDAAIEATDAGIQVFAVGIGSGYEVEDLLALVTPSNGTVFGDSDVDKIEVVFSTLAGRIDSFVATNVHLDLTLAPGVRPGVAYLWVTTLPQHDEGNVEIARIELRYDVPPRGLLNQRRQVGISVRFAADGVREPDGEVVAAFRRASLAQLARRFLEAYRQRDHDIAGETLQLLVQRSDELGNAALKERYESLLRALRAGGEVSHEELNDLVVESTTTRARQDAPALYNLVLLDPGPALIRVIREIRDATGRGLREVADIIDSEERVLVRAMQHADAVAMQERIESAGARVEIRGVARATSR